MQVNGQGRQTPQQMAERLTDVAYGTGYGFMSLLCFGMTGIAYTAGYCDAEPLKNWSWTELTYNCGDPSRSLVSNVIFPMAGAAFTYHCYCAFERAYVGREDAQERAQERLRQADQNALQALSGWFTGS